MNWELSLPVRGPEEDMLCVYIDNTVSSLGQIEFGLSSCLLISFPWVWLSSAVYENWNCQCVFLFFLPHLLLSFTDVQIYGHNQSFYSQNLFIDGSPPGCHTLFPGLPKAAIFLPLPASWGVLGVRTCGVGEAVRTQDCKMQKWQKYPFVLDFQGQSLIFVLQRRYGVSIDGKWGGHLKWYWWFLNSGKIFLYCNGLKNEDVRSWPQLCKNHKVPTP